jgi:sulfur-oxidizing protein SoxZ
MSDPMRIRAQMQGEKCVVRVLMRHDMETGQRRDTGGKAIPAHFIQTVTATHAGKTVLSAQWGPAIAKDPFLQFQFAGAKVGDTVEVTWTDNKSDKRTDTAKVA